MGSGVNHVIAYGVMGGELILLVIAAAGYLFVLYRRSARRVGALEQSFRTIDAGRARYMEFLRRAAGSTQVRFREINPAGRLPLDPGGGPYSPLMHAIGLRYSLLQQELAAARAVASRPEAFWEERIAHMDAVLREFDAVQARLSAAARGQIGQGPGSGDDRVRDLEAYRQRFNALHSHVIEERSASSRFRKVLRDLAADDPDEERLLAAVKTYERERLGLDRFLERADMEPFDARSAGPGRVPSDTHRNRRARVLMERTDARLVKVHTALRKSLRDQRETISSLNRSLEHAEEKEERLRSYYSAEVRKLQKEVDQQRRHVSSLEKEVYRRSKIIKTLLERLDDKAEAAPEVEALQATIDRFSRQAMDLTERIGKLERENEALRAGGAAPGAIADA